MKSMAHRFLRTGTIALAAATAFVVAATSAARADQPERPVLVGNRFVSVTDGSIVGTVPGGSPYTWSEPVPGEAGKFRHEDLFVDAAKMTTTTDGIIAVSNPTVRDTRISLLGKGGAVQWAYPSYDSLRPPLWAEGSGVIALAVEDGVTGVNETSGVKIWHSGRPQDRLIAAHGLVVAVDGDTVAARRLTDGVETWRATLPEDSDPQPAIATGDILIVSNEGTGSNGWTRAYAADGSLQFVLDGEALHAAHQIAPGGDVIVVTVSESKLGPYPGRVGNNYITSSSRTARLTRSGQEIWHVTPPIPAFTHTPARIYPLADGLILVETHLGYSDDGVHLAKIDTATGAVAWHITARGLGISHSKYWQRVYVEFRGTELVLVSQGMGGHFVERRTITDGALIHRWTIPPGYWPPNELWLR